MNFFKRRRPQFASLHANWKQGLAPQPGCFPSYFVADAAPTSLKKGPLVLHGCYCTSQLNKLSFSYTWHWIVVNVLTKARSKRETTCSNLRGTNRTVWNQASRRCLTLPDRRNSTRTFRILGTDHRPWSSGMTAQGKSWSRGGRPGRTQK